MSQGLTQNQEHPVYVVGETLLAGAGRVRLRLAEEVAKDISDPQDLQELLRLARATTDQLEMAYVKALQLRRQAEAELALAKAEVEEAEIVSAKEVRREAGEFASAKEKSIGFSLATLDQRRKERVAMETYQQARHLVEVLQMLHKGVDSTRQDVSARLRAITLTTSLERG